MATPHRQRNVISPNVDTPPPSHKTFLAATFLLFGLLFVFLKHFLKNGGCVWEKSLRDVSEGFPHKKNPQTVLAQEVAKD